MADSNGNLTAGFNDVVDVIHAQFGALARIAGSQRPGEDEQDRMGNFILEQLERNIHAILRRIQIAMSRLEHYLRHARIRSEVDRIRHAINSMTIHPTWRGFDFGSFNVALDKLLATPESKNDNRVLDQVFSDDPVGDPNANSAESGNVWLLNLRDKPLDGSADIAV